MSLACLSDLYRFPKTRVFYMNKKDEDTQFSGPSRFKSDIACLEGNEGEPSKGCVPRPKQAPKGSSVLIRT
jgi:hypothetical protein